MLLNILIAVVGDSHEHAMIDANLIFLRNRIEQAAQVGSGDADSWAWRLVNSSLRPLLRPLLFVEKAESDGDASSMWEGRALELEKRTRDVIVEQGDRTSRQVERGTEQMAAMRERVDRMDAGMTDAMKQLGQLQEVNATIKEQLGQIMLKLGEGSGAR